MILVDCEQNTKAWFDARLGIPTASCFSKMMTPKKRQQSAATPYRMSLLAEWLMGEQDESFQSERMERGFLLQPDAIKEYEFQTDRKVKPMGFAYLDERRLIGASPDGFPDEGNLEIKCRMAGKHLAVVLSGVVPDEDMAQVQGQMWVTGKPWCHYMNFHPELPGSIILVERDEDYIADLSRCVEAFVEVMLEEREQLIQRGFVPAKAA